MSEAELKRRKWDNTKLSMSVFFANKVAVVGLIIIMIYVVDALIVQFFPQLLGITNVGSLVPNFINPAPSPPSMAHLFGTTYPGVDLFTSTIKAIRIDLFYSVLVVAIGAAVGSLIGVISAYVGGLMDEIVMRITDVFFSIPYLILALAVGFVLGRSLLNMSIALAIVWWPLYARYTRSQTLSTKEFTFVEAAKASGVSRVKIMFKHILPNSLPPVFIQISLDLGSIMVIFSTLAFIGFIANASVPELGYLTSLGLNYVQTAPWTVIFPGLAITLFALAVNLVGDGLRDVMDPRRRS
ncbi:MAG: ABC transporter permease [Candidatus Bathyarchaeia archaeon]|jgi:peptide/nickel transport system permease protein